MIVDIVSSFLWKFIFTHIVTNYHTKHVTDFLDWVKY